MAESCCYDDYVVLDCVYYYIVDKLTGVLNIKMKKLLPEQKVDSKQ